MLISDSTGITRLTIWEDEIGQIVPNNSYRLVDVAVKEFKDKKFLSTVRNESTIEPIDDIGVVVENDQYDDEVPSSDGSLSTNAKVIAANAPN